MTFNAELNALRKIICSKKSAVFVERISVCNVIEKLAEHGIHGIPCMPCSSQIISEMLPESHTMEKSDFFSNLYFNLE